MRSLVLLCSIIALAGGVVLAADSPAPTVVPAAQVQWTPGTGPLAGTQVANIFGDPSKPGPFVTRVQMPDGTVLGPHFHPVLENVTVLQGTLMVGIGDTIDKSKMVALPAGSFVSVPPNVHHYAMAQGETTIQLNDVGPWGMTPVK
jgi:quercetin dioxygenase-like cupin family protein